MGFNPEEEAAWAVVSSAIDRLVAQVAGYNLNAMAPKKMKSNEDSSAGVQATHLNRVTQVLYPQYVD